MQGNLFQDVLQGQKGSAVMKFEVTIIVTITSASTPSNTLRTNTAVNMNLQATLKSSECSFRKLLVVNQLLTLIFLDGSVIKAYASNSVSCWFKPRTVIGDHGFLALQSTKKGQCRKKISKFSGCALRKGTN